MRTGEEILKYLERELKKVITADAKTKGGVKSAIVQVLILEVLLDIREELVKSRVPCYQIMANKFSKEQVEKLLAEIAKDISHELRQLP